MATYCFSCRWCGAGFELTVNTVGEMPCPACGREGLSRDYRAENVGVAVVMLQRERERGGASAVRDLFLPTAKDFESPADPDGSKGITEWNDTHDPRPGNARPLRPESPKKVF